MIMPIILSGQVGHRVDLPNMSERLAMMNMIAMEQGWKETAPFQCILVSCLMMVGDFVPSNIHDIIETEQMLRTFHSSR